MMFNCLVSFLLTNVSIKSNKLVKALERNYKQIVTGSYNPFCI